MDITIECPVKKSNGVESHTGINHHTELNIADHTGYEYTNTSGSDLGYIAYTISEVQI